MCVYVCMHIYIYIHIYDVAAEAARLSGDKLQVEYIGLTLNP